MIMDVIPAARRVENGEKVEKGSRVAAIGCPEVENLAPAIAIGDDMLGNLTIEIDASTRSVDSCEEPELGPFSGATHPPEPVDTDVMQRVYVAQQKKSTKAPFPDGNSRLDTECLIEMQAELDAIPVSPDVAAPRASPRARSQDCIEKECVWDASASASSDLGPRCSMESAAAIAATTGAVGSFCTSSCRSDGTMGESLVGVERMKSGKKNSRGELLESAKTSASRASDSSGLSDDSNWSNATGSASKPHKGNDPRWKAIHVVRSRDGALGMSHFRLLKRLGCGDIGSVYLSELGGTRCYFAMKVMDKASLASRKKLARAQTEREILQLLDHPFLPTLYTHFETDRFTCLVMEFCPGGDLHTLRQRQPGKFFSECAARFYAAEVLLALEYLHMLGVVYRDLKPENVLVREDGHIMLSDFDLSLQCTVSPTLIRTSSLESDPSKRGGAFCIQPACAEPSAVCIQPSCFLPRFLPQRSKKKLSKSRSELGPHAGALPELVAEPTTARSMSFVGTHEYLAPEIIKGEGHGSAVDWWTFGIFVHELLFGKTPFKGSGNRATLFNVVGQQLRCPETPPTSYASRDLIRGLLVKEPQHRLGFRRGATEIKQHPFFEGVNWALIRCSSPPEIPRPVEASLAGKTGAAAGAGVIAGSSGSSSNKMAGTEVKGGGKYLDFEFF